MSLHAQNCHASLDPRRRCWLLHVLSFHVDDATSSSCTRTMSKGGGQMAVEGYLREKEGEGSHWIQLKKTDVPGLPKLVGFEVGGHPTAEE
jgi:hypothetical protein